MDEEEVVKNLRACLISSKGGVKIENLSRDYKMLIDEQIPFRKLGYQSLVSFLRTVPGIRIVEKGPEVFVEAIPTEESVHITRLIATQKTSTKKRPKLVNARKQAPFRQPVTTKRNYRTTRSGYDNLYSQISGRQNTSVPAISTKVTIYQNNEKPRYIQSQYGIPPSSPSKRLKNRQMNSVLAENQSVNKPRDNAIIKNNVKTLLPVINQKPKTVNNNVETLKKPDINAKLKSNSNIPALQNLNTSISTPSHQSEILSPLSPGQALADGNRAQFQQSLVSLTSNLSDNAKKIAPKPHFTDPRDELKARANALNLPEPIYQIYPIPTKNTKEAAVFAQVKIGAHHGYSSYPEEARSEEEAQKIAAKFALLDLVEKTGQVSLNETKNKAIIKERVLSIVDGHPNGIFMHKVPIYYKQQYQEILPCNWERVIEECPAVILEKGVDNSIILRRFVSSAEKVRNIKLPKVEKIQLNPIGPVVPVQLELPEEQCWLASVICVISTVEIWVRIIEDAYSEQFNVMVEEMAKHYSNVQQSAKAVFVEVGNYYAIFEDESWHRVRCVDYNSATGMATVSFIDHGDEDTFHYSRLQTLDKRFCLLPAQALRVCLAGLEDFSDCDSIVSYLENLLLDRALYVEVISRGKNQDESFATVIFYDTHGPDDINLNSELSKKILQHVVVAPKLSVEGQVSEAFISHIEENGDVYIQIQSESMKLLVNLLSRLIYTGLNAEDLESCMITTVDVNKTYFLSVKNKWHRVKVVGDIFQNQLKVFLIDFGKTITASRSNLLSLERLSEILAKFPPQALKVHLHNIDKSMFNEKMVARLMELAPKGEPLLVKVVSSANDTAVVELFKRIQPSNMLVSINNTLALEDLTKVHGDGNNNIKLRKRVERMNSKLSGVEDDENVRSLKPPNISGIGEYFDIHVTMAAHPGNFTIQPFGDRRSLELMMIQLQEVCQAYKGSPPTSETVREGKIYAAQHTDGHWYRVCISSIIKENMVSVYFCDFGDISVLPLQKLQPLKSQFLELPYQAIKARLAGIRPIHVDWSVEDSLRFQELVVEKDFVSVVVESKPDELSPADTILGVKLIDVNTKEDIYIDQLLVDEGRAIFID